MLREPATFPAPGSFAVCKGHRGTVRIQRINRDGTYLIAGPHVSARSVPLDKLTEARDPRTAKQVAA